MVYKYDSKAKKYKKAKILAKSKASWTNKKLKSNKVYRYKIRSFNKKNGKKKYSSYSYMVSSKTYTNKAKTVNVKSVKTDFTNHYLGLKKVVKVEAWISVPKGKKAINRKLAWKSSNSSIVTVSKTGWIQAKGKAGTAKVYIRAHNGVTKTLKVTVKDYAHPKKFTNLDKVGKIDSNAANLLAQYKDNMYRVAACFEKQKIRYFSPGMTSTEKSGLRE